MAEESEWIPKTELGKMVKKGEITNMEQIYEKDLAILEPEIADLLVPNLNEEVLKIKTVQRTTDSGRRGSFMITAVVGNKDGFVGVGTGKGSEVRPTIERAVKNAKKNIIHIRRGCGSWQCNCNEPHSVPFKISGKFGSVRVKLMPAPAGTGVVLGETGRKVAEFAGIKDVWSKTEGNTASVFNFAGAVLDALRKTRKTRLLKEVGGV